MKTAVIYARYSCSSQTEQSIEGQMSVCNKYAQDNNLLVVDTYVDRAMTGTNDNRAGFQRMLKDSETANWDIVLVYAIDRFGRNSIEIALNKQKLKNNNKLLISATQRMSENIDGTKNLDGILLENVYIGIAEYYSAELSQKIKRGLSESRNKGLFCGGTVPYGYYVEDKRIKIDETKAEIVRYIFTQYSLDVPVSKITQNLEERGVLHRGKPFKETTIYQMLKNEKYIGITRVNGEVYLNLYQQIVDVEVFEKVRKKTMANKLGRASSYTRYLLKNKLRCGYCGMPISAESGTSYNGEIKFYYKCIGRKKYRNGCENKPIRKEMLEQVVIDAIVAALADDDKVDELVEKIYEMQTKGIEEQIAIKNLQKERRQIEFGIGNIVNAIEKGIIADSTNQRLHDLEESKRKIDEQLAIEKAKASVVISKEEIKAYYKGALEMEGAMLISCLIDKVLVYNDKLEIIFTTPIKRSPDANQGFLLYTGCVDDFEIMVKI